ncbi:hypothetical protein AMECASPLE_037524 [Ameca splendens]|uniref:Uncharacterized protein n=1 Tax=Ameca splendens TaxID=208324 RepID=A0ABV0ZGP6_9TELE
MLSFGIKRNIARSSASSAVSLPQFPPHCETPTVESCLVPKTGRTGCRSSIKHQSSKAREPNWFKNESSFGRKTLCAPVTSKSKSHTRLRIGSQLSRKASPSS